MFGKLLLRDLGVASVVGAAWLLTWPLSAGPGPLADLTGVALGFGAGLAAFLAHEWGHFVGALLTGARVHAPPTWTSAFLFSFDSERNSQMQFLVMSLTGFAVTAVGLYVAYALLPPDALATRVARGILTFLASLTLLLEVPLLVISLVKGSILKQAEVFPPVTDFADTLPRI